MLKVAGLPSQAVCGLGCVLIAVAGSTLKLTVTDVTAAPHEPFTTQSYDPACVELTLLIVNIADVAPAMFVPSFLH
jgi:hypothetical protein